MKINFFLLMLGIFLNLSTLAQDSLVAYWGFNNEAKLPQNFPFATRIINKLENKVSKAFRLTGKNYFHPKESINLHNSFTLVFWFKVDSLPANNSFQSIPLFCQTQIETDKKEELAKTTRIEIKKQEIVVNDYNYKFVVKEKTWHFLALTFNGCETAAYFDSLPPQNNGITKINHQPFLVDSLFLGRSWNKASFLKGAIDEIMIFSKPLSATSIRKLYREEHQLKDTLILNNFPSINISQNKFEEDRNLNENNAKIVWNFEKDSVFGNSEKTFQLSYHNGASRISCEIPSLGKNVINHCANLKKPNEYLEIKPYFYLPEKFAFSFWFFPKRIDTLQTILSFQNIKEKQLFQINILNQDSINLFFKNGKNTANLQLKTKYLEKEKWSYFYCTFNNCDFSVFLGYDKIYSGKIPINIRNAIIFDQCYIGKNEFSKNSFTGNIDNILLYNLYDNEKLVRNLRNFSLANFKEKKIPKVDSSFWICKVHNRPSRILKKMTIHETNISVKVWDNDIVDGDSVSVSLNGTNDNNLGVKGKYNIFNLLTGKNKIKYELEPDTTNCLVFYALNIGKYPPNTAKVQIKCGKEIIIDTIIESTLDTSAAILFTPKPKIQILAKTSFEINDTNILFLIRDKSSADGDKVNVYLNGKKFITDYLLKNDFDTFNLTLKSNFANEFLFESTCDGNSGNNTAEIYILVKGNPIPVRTFSLQAMKGKNKEKLIIKHKTKKK